MATGFLTLTFAHPDGPRLFGLYVPSNYDPTRTWPTILFLHRIEDCSFKGLQINGICHGQGLASPRDTVVIAG